jgi:carbon starvation protein
LPVRDYYAMNTDLAKVPEWSEKILQVGGGGGIEHITIDTGDNLPQYERLTQESLRGRTGGAVTLAVGMAHIFDEAARKFMSSNKNALEALWKYWYHFAIMFEALFILTTIDTGTRIGRFLLQEVFGNIHPKLGQTSWWPSAIASTALIVGAWSYFIQANSMDVIWPMFGVGNQMLSVIALAVVSAYLINEGKARYVWIVLVPMSVVATTTTTAAIEMLLKHITTIRTQLAKPAPDWSTLFNSALQGSLIAAMVICGAVVVTTAVRKVYGAFAASPRAIAVRAE